MNMMKLLRNIWLKENQMLEIVIGVKEFLILILRLNLKMIMNYLNNKDIIALIKNKGNLKIFN